jgi:glycosyltransferase involved in cell wall biosynthesis
MKIAFIYDAVYPWVKGGAEKRVYEIAKHLIQSGHEVHWYCVGWWWTENHHEDIIHHGIHLHGVCKPSQLYSDGVRSFKEPLTFGLKLIRPLMKENFDIIDCQGFPYFSCFPARLHSMMGKSTLFITWIEIWDDYWYEYIGRKGFFVKLVEKAALNLNSNWIAISSKVKEDLKNYKPEKPVNVIPMGIDSEEIAAVEVSPRSSDIIFAGRLIKEKNVDLLIRSVDMVRKRQPNIQCLIIGNGPERENLQKLTEKLELNNNITFMDFLEKHHQLISYIKSSKVFVLPSTREGFGIVVLEANACGKPVVVIDNKMNAACHLVHEGVNGFITNMDEESMMTKILEGLSEYENMYPECVNMANKFDWNTIIPELVETYHNSMKDSFDE